LPFPPFQLLADASLFLDFDGTLIELAETPDAVRVDPRTVDLVGRLAEALPGRVALVSGRSVEQIRNLLAAEVTVVGSHGMEFGWRDGRSFLVERPLALDEV